MDRLETQDIRVDAEYEQARESARRDVTELKRHRRIVLADTVAIVFENRETVRNTVEEVIRAEGIHNRDGVADEVAAFNAILPEPGELLALLYIEAEDATDLARHAAEFAGIDQCVRLEVGGVAVAAGADSIETGEAAPAVSRLRFRPSAEQARRWQESEVAVAVEHPACSARVVLAPEQRAALAADLEVSGARGAL